MLTLYQTYRLVDGATIHHILSFLDAYSGHNQIQMHPRDKGKIAFMVDCNNFYYEVMPFGLKNVGATYWWLFTASAPRLSKVIIVPKDGYRSHKEQWIIEYNNR